MSPRAATSCKIVFWRTRHDSNVSEGLPSRLIARIGCCAPRNQSIALSGCAYLRRPSLASTALGPDKNALSFDGLDDGCSAPMSIIQACLCH
jgi:hypothetical protein